MAMQIGVQKVWKYDCGTLCEITGKSRYQVRREIKEKVFDPSDLWSVAKYLMMNAVQKKVSEL